MKKLMTAAAAVTLVFGVAACGETAEAPAETGLSGTWKANAGSAEFENSINSYTVADGTYTCNHCIPPFSVTVDGEWQSVERPGVDNLKVTIVDDSTLESSSRKGEEVLGESVWNVSEDGQTMTLSWTNFRGDETTNGSTTYARASAGPDGSHAVSGEWTVSQLGEMSDAAVTWTYTIDGDTITSTGNSGGYTATLGGDPVTPEDDDTGRVLAVEKTGKNSYRETYSRDGEVINVLDLTVDGDTLSGVSTDPRDGSTVRWTATRQ